MPLTSGDSGDRSEMTGARGIFFIADGRQEVLREADELMGPVAVLSRAGPA